MESGIKERFKTKWQPLKKSVEEKTTPIVFDQVFAIFFILFFGYLAAVLVLIVEYYFHKCHF